MADLSALTLIVGLLKNPGIPCSPQTNHGRGYARGLQSRCLSCVYLHRIEFTNDTVPIRPLYFSLGVVRKRPSELAKQLDERPGLSTIHDVIEGTHEQYNPHAAHLRQRERTLTNFAKVHDHVDILNRCYERLLSRRDVTVGLFLGHLAFVLGFANRLPPEECLLVAARPTRYIPLHDALHCLLKNLCLC